MFRFQKGKPRKWGIGAFGAGLSVLLGLFGLLPPWGKGLINFSYDSAFLFRPNIPVDEAVIIYMDLDSLERLGQGNGLWDRKQHAKLIDRLTALRAKAVVFDVVFASFTNDPTADAELVRAAKMNGKVVLAASVIEDRFEGESLSIQLRKPFPELEAVATWGLAAAAFDGYVRKEYHRKDLNAPSLGWQAARVSTGRIPVAPKYQERWLNYCGPSGMVPHFKYWEVMELTNEITVNDFSNRVVFIGSIIHSGLTGDQKKDFFPTPYSRWRGTQTAGVEINATSYVNLVRGNWLERTSVATEFGLLVLAGTVFGWLLTCLRPLPAASVALLSALGIGLVANLLVWKTRVWFPWMVVSGMQIPVALAWSVLSHTRRLAQEKRKLEQALAMAALREQSTPAPAPETAKPAPTLTTQLAPPAPAAHNNLAIPDYTLVRKIGEGAYGEVWLARNIIGSCYAAKFVHRWHFAEAAPFEREFHGIKKYTPISRGHSGLVQVLHIGRNQDPEYIYYVMELADDELSGQNINLETYAPRNLAKELNKRLVLPLAEAVEISLQLAEALAYLHARDLIHRDIKPSNIIFVHGIAKLADIGLVTQIATEGRDVSYLGTEGYIPPEGPGTPAADVYSLGKVMYQTVTGLHVGRFPELPSAMMEGVLDSNFVKLNQIMLKACEVDPKKRYQSAVELQLALAALHKTIGHGHNSSS